MNLISIPWLLLGFLGFGEFGMATLPYKKGWWDKHSTMLSPKIFIVLNHAQISMEFSTCLGGVIARIACILFGCGFMPVLVAGWDIHRYSILIVQNFDFWALTHKTASCNLACAKLKWSMWSSRFSLMMSKLSRLI